MSLLPRGGVYAILNITTQSAEQAGQMAAHAVTGGAVLIQYRHKGDDPKLRTQGAKAVLKAIGDVPLLINDDVELAAQIGADGVHLGQTDGDVSQARSRLGPRAIIGVTCHASLEYAEAAVAAGADYVSFGRFFASKTKPGASRAPMEVLEKAREKLGCPVVAIGGINAETGMLVLASGADFLAISGAIFDQPNISTATREIADLFKV